MDEDKYIISFALQIDDNTWMQQEIETTLDWHWDLYQAYKANPLCKNIEIYKVIYQELDPETFEPYDHQ